MKNPKLLGIKFLTVGLLACIGYLYFSGPSRLVISSDLEITGSTNLAREALQGERFWKEQRAFARRQLDRLQTQPQKDRENRQQDARDDAELRRALETTYRENPESRPSTSTVQAERLRKKADRIEADELDRSLEAARIKRIDHLERIITFIDAKVVAP